ncbi:hypothetical protein ACMXYR_02715 [Neptuniibacter sp. QD29_5]|uniref:hypothetical protein n=1 Tax=Neptuniibacter sp. QD29_5 TaxID=3398207 RepID=UPI0039F4EC7E
MKAFKDQLVSALYRNSLVKKIILLLFIGFASYIVSDVLFSRTIYKVLHPLSFVDIFLLVLVCWKLRDSHLKLKKFYAFSFVFGFCSILFLASGYRYFYGIPLDFSIFSGVYDLFIYDPLLSCVLVLWALVSVFFVAFGLVVALNKRYLSLLFLLFVSSPFMWEDPDWNPSEQYYKRGFFYTFSGEVLYKTYLLYSNSNTKGDSYLADVNSTQELKKGNKVIIGVLESLFIDDTVMSFVPNAKDYTFFMKSPTFAGESARSEFEILCGIPSYKFYGVEFNFINRKISCLPSVFLGKSLVVNANSKFMFNANRVYDFLGFDDKFWPKYTAGFKDRPGGYIYDGQVLSAINDAYDKGDYDFIYFVGAYGHHPYYRNKSLRPDLFKDNNVEYEKVVNQSIYRLHDVLNFIKKYEAEDSFVLICADHNPYIKGHEYGEGKYKVSCLSNKQQINYKNLYEIPKSVLSYLGVYIDDVDYEMYYKQVVP